MYIIIAILVFLFPINATFANQTKDKTNTSYAVNTYVKGLKHPWGLAFLPDGRLLVTEKEGILRIIEKNGQLSKPVKNLMSVYNSGQGGLLDVALDPDFKNNRTIYLSYSKPEPDNKSRTAVARAQLKGQALENVTTIWQQSHAEKKGFHYGSRLVFDRDGYLFVTLGDRGSRKEDAQNLSTHFGKIVRIDTNGKPAPDNPFIKDKNALPDIWSYGHRNIQGAYLHPETGELWTNEHGPRGGDEINKAEGGKNYGWPVITYGINYNGTPITDKTHMPGMQQPVHYWDPSIATSGLLIYSGNTFPNWKGNLFTGALRAQHISRIVLDKENKVIHEERILSDQNERIRAVTQGPNGYLYALTDSPKGRVLKISPVTQ